MLKQVFVTGIGTGVGKTVVSAVLTQYLQASYWKPVQAGDLEQSDTMLIRSLVDAHLQLYPEGYGLHTAASPHQAAAIDGLSIDLGELALPVSEHSLVVEGAGGLFVPLNDEAYIIDLIERLKLPVVLVVRDYLGCINHTILSIEALKQRGLEIGYVVFNGAFNPYTERAIKRALPEGMRILHIPTLADLDRKHVKELAEKLIFREVKSNAD